MNTYLMVKALHILSSVLMVGTGFGTTFYLYFANRAGSREAISVVSRLVVRADLWFTTPAVIFQPISGLWLAHANGWPWTTGWIVDVDIVCNCRRLLVARRLVADSVAEYCSRSSAHSDYATRTILALCENLGAARIPSVHRYAGGLFVDGAQTSHIDFRFT